MSLVSQPWEIKEAVGRYLPTSSLAQLSLTSKIMQQRPTMEQCCVEPTIAELIRYLHNRLKYLDATIVELPIDEKTIGNSTIVIEQLGSSVELQPLPDLSGWLYVRGSEEDLVEKELRTSKQYNKWLHGAKLSLSGGHSATERFQDILRLRMSCQGIPKFIEICSRQWFLRRLKKFKSRDRNEWYSTMDDLFSLLRDDIAKEAVKQWGTSVWQSFSEKYIIPGTRSLNMSGILILRKEALRIVEDAFSQDPIE